MTKEQLIKRVDIAVNVYELLKEVPVQERHGVMALVEQLNQKDWQELQNNQIPPSNCDVSTLKASR